MGDVLTPEEVTCRWKTIVGAIRASGPVMERLAAVGALGKHEVALRAQLAEVTRERDEYQRALDEIHGRGYAGAEYVAGEALRSVRAKRKETPHV